MISSSSLNFFLILILTSLYGYSQNDSVRIKQIDSVSFYNANSEDIPFAIIDESATFEFCGGDNFERKKCFSLEMNRHVVANFNKKNIENLGLESGKKKIYAYFKILKSGEIEITSIKSPHPELEKETRRVVNLLPKMTPGEQGGKPVNVMYMMPISFNVK